MVNKKICIVGSHGVGKTTLVNLLSTKLKIPVISEISRNFTKEQLQYTNIEYPDVQKNILKLQLLEESKHDSFISDRSSIDNLAYYIYGCYDKLSLIENNSYICESINNAWNYTHVFLLRPEFPIECDNFRETNAKYQYDIDMMIKCILQLYIIKYYQLTGSIEDRLHKALEILKW